MSGIPAWAVRGRKVVCIDSVWECDDPTDADLPDPVKGQTYTILDTDMDDDDGAGLYLVEFGDDAFYTIDGFRPIVDIEAQLRDVAMFRKLLTQNTPELVE
jgi:hypothetical protein